MSWQYDHTHFKCSDPEKTVAFFKENFGAKEVKRFEVNRMSIVTLDIGGLWYNFSSKRPGETVEPKTQPARYGVYHIALKTRDLAAEAAKMKARGVKFTQEVAQSDPKTKFAFVEGPDGISIEILQRD
ncbi:MAG TPA: VOC family protein [Candidatus Methylomirabilis sp.]|nr:VOC family protein [Candidatus Methylomirabilis sp.]